MDPSNPYYNDPNRPLNPAPQQPQAYYPPIQGPYPQQGNPGVQNTSYSGYNPNNTIQYMPYTQQQPQPVHMPSDRASILGHGAYTCYKIVLILYTLLLIYKTFVLVGWFEEDLYGDDLYLYFFDGAMIFIPFILSIVQILAINQKSYSMAKFAFTGFVTYLILRAIYTFAFY